MAAQFQRCGDFGKHNDCSVSLWSAERLLILTTNTEERYIAKATNSQYFTKSFTKKKTFFYLHWYWPTGRYALRAVTLTAWQVLRVTLQLRTLLMLANTQTKWVSFALWRINMLEMSVFYVQHCATPGIFFMYRFRKELSTMKLLVRGIIPFSTSSLELPTTRFCLKEITVLTSGKALKTSSLNCCSKVVSVCSWSTDVLFLEARHSAVFCALSKITTSKDRVECFTRELACWTEGKMIIMCASVQKTDQWRTNYGRSGGKAMNTQIQIASTILAKKSYLILS